MDWFHDVDGYQIGLETVGWWDACAENDYEDIPCYVAVRELGIVTIGMKMSWLSFTASWTGESAVRPHRVER